MKFKITSSKQWLLGTNHEELFKKYPFLKSYNFESNEKEAFISINSLEELLELQKLSCSLGAWGLVILSADEQEPFEIEIYDDYRE